MLTSGSNRYPAILCRIIDSKFLGTEAQGRDVILQISILDLATQLKLELAAVQKVSVGLEH